MRTAISIRFIFRKCESRDGGPSLKSISVRCDTVANYPSETGPIVEIACYQVWPAGPAERFAGNDVRGGRYVPNPSLEDPARLDDVDWISRRPKIPWPTSSNIAIRLMDGSPFLKPRQYATYPRDRRRADTVSVPVARCREASRRGDECATRINTFTAASLGSAIADRDFRRQALKIPCETTRRPSIWLSGRRDLKSDRPLSFCFI